MRKPPDFTGFGGYGPVPDNDPPVDNVPGGNHYESDWHDRAPGGTRTENPSDYWLDCMVYPDRADSTDANEPEQFRRAISLSISVGNATGRKSGPSDEGL
jgi:hypothetical protein